MSDLHLTIREDCRTSAASSTKALEALRGEAILVTGGTGFVGTWIAEMVAFLNDEHGFEIELLLLSTRANNWSARAPHLALRRDIELIERDVRSVVDIPSRVRWIIHAAGNPDSRQHASDPLATVDVIANGTRAVLNAATRLPELRKFLNVSSGLVYGAQPWELDAISENWQGSLDSAALSSAYAEAKRFGETLCSVFRNQHKLAIVNARPFAFIGPYQLLDRPWAINNFMRDALQGGPIRILGSGETVRSYMYPSDMTLWMLRLLVDGKVGASYNVGSSHAVSLEELARKVAAFFPLPPQIVTRGSVDSKTHRSKFVPDVELAQSALGLKSEFDLDAALRRTLRWNQMRGGALNGIA